MAIRIALTLMILTPLFCGAQDSEVPRGRIVREIQALGEGWADNLAWMPGETTAVWMEHAPNMPQLSRLTYWNGRETGYLLAAGALDYKTGIVDSQQLLLVSSRLPDSSSWEARTVLMCRPPERCRTIGLPTGKLPGLVQWRRGTDSLDLAVCMKPGEPPVHFVLTMDGSVSRSDAPCKVVDPFPVGIPPADTCEACYRALFDEDTSKTIAKNLSGDIPSRELRFDVDFGRILVFGGEDTLTVPFQNAGEIIDVAWDSSGKRALVSMAGNPSRVALVVLVFD